MSCLAASFCNLTMVLSNFGLWFLFCLGIMASRETRRKPTAESTMLSQNQRNSSYRWLFISLTHALRPPLGVSGDGGNKTTETTPHQQSRISGCLKFLFETCHKIHFGPYLYIELWFFLICYLKTWLGHVCIETFAVWLIQPSPHASPQALTPLVFCQLHEDLLVLIDISFLHNKGSFGSAQWV